MDKFLNKIICGDTLTTLKTFPDNCIDLIITSPPYYGLRRYGDYKEQIGLEPTFDEFFKKILEITAELKRVLKPTGQFWLNLGDCYGTGSGAGSRKGTKQATNTGSNYYEESGKEPPGEAKCLLMMPERITISMCDSQGWILRNKIAWSKQILDFKEKRTKGSVMPSSTTDRFNESWEYLYFFVKNKTPLYWTNPITKETIYKKPPKEKEGVDFEWRMRKGKMAKITLWDAHDYYSDLDAVRLPPQSELNRAGGMERLRTMGYDTKYKKDYLPENQQSPARTQRKSFEARMEDTKNKDQKSSRTYNMKKLLSEVRLGIKPNTGMVKRENVEILKGRRRDVGLYDRMGENIIGKNLPTVWLIGSEPHNFQREYGSEVDHFATFPEALCEIPIRFGSPKNGIIFDPFCGSGTALVVAKKLGRNYIGIDLNPKYIEIAQKRLNSIPPSLF